MCSLSVSEQTERARTYREVPTGTDLRNFSGVARAGRCSLGVGMTFLATWTRACGFGLADCPPLRFHFLGQPKPPDFPLPVPGEAVPRSL